MNMEPKDLQTTTPATAEPAVRPETGPSRRQRLGKGLRKLLRGKKRKAVALLLVVAIVGGVVIWRGQGQTAAAVTEYQEASVERRSVTNSLSASGTLEPADSYTVNTLVSGEILSEMCIRDRSWLGNRRSMPVSCISSMTALVRRTTSSWEALATFRP